MRYRFVVLICSCLHLTVAESSINLGGVDLEGDAHSPINAGSIQCEDAEEFEVEQVALLQSKIDLSPAPQQSDKTATAPRRQQHTETRAEAANLPDAAQRPPQHSKSDTSAAIATSKRDIKYVAPHLIQRKSLVDGKGHEGRQAPVEMPWVVPANEPKDFLFHSVTTECKPTVPFDNYPETVLSRVFLPVVFLMCIAAIASNAKLNRSTKADQTDHVPRDTLDDDSAQKSAQSSEKPERLVHLDFGRISAIMCVIFEHSGGMGYTRRNMGFGLWWGLPVLYITSGMGFVMSKSSMLGYVLRLLAIFVVGVGFNWTADVITHRDWQGDFANTIFQMTFIIMLIAMSFITEILRQDLVLSKDKSNSKPTNRSLAAMAVFGLLTAFAFLRFAYAVPLFPLSFEGEFGQYYFTLTQNLSLILIQFCGMLFLCSLACMLPMGENVDLVGWILLAFIYLPSIAVPWHQDQFVRLLQLYIFGMVTVVWPLRGKETLARIVQSYWPFVMMILVLISMPDMVGRCDMFPPGTLWERVRFKAGEMIMVVSFVTGAFLVKDPYNVSGWLGRWALFAYVSHVCWYRLFGSPAGALITISSGVIFFALHACSKSQASDPPLTGNK